MTSINAENAAVPASDGETLTRLLHAVDRLAAAATARAATAPRPGRPA